MKKLSVVLLALDYGALVGAFAPAACSARRGLNHGQLPVLPRVAVRPWRARIATVRTPQPAMRYIGPNDPRGLIGPGIFLFLLLTGGLGWVFNLLNGIFLFVFVAPFVVGPIFNWYLTNNLLEGACPECGAPVQLFKGQAGQCVNCASTMSSEQGAGGVFMRNSAASSQEDGVVEVDVEVD